VDYDVAREEEDANGRDGAQTDATWIVPHATRRDMIHSRRRRGLRELRFASRTATSDGGDVGEFSF